MPFRLANDAHGRDVGTCLERSWGLTITCACGENRRWTGRELSAYPPATPLADIAARLVCSTCGGVDGILALNNAGWHPGMEGGNA